MIELPTLMLHSKVYPLCIAAQIMMLAPIDGTTPNRNTLNAHHAQRAAQPEQIHVAHVEYHVIQILSLDATVRSYRLGA